MLQIRQARQVRVPLPTLTERQKLSVARLSRILAALALAATLLSAPAAAGKGMTFTSPQAAYEQGIGALKAGRLEIALPALEYAASKEVFLAQFYLARMYADNSGPYTDHAKAYMLYQRIADEHADVDPDYDQRAPFVARSFTALAGYLLSGLSEISLKPTPHRAAEYLQHAATYFNDQDAQFELAKLYLKGEGVPEDTKLAVHWLSVLTEKGHASAQAFLADLYWRGKHVPKNEGRALALITVAVEHAPVNERIWIEDIHQNIFCGASLGVRNEADGLVADWRQRYGRRQTVTIDRHGLSPLQIGPVRTCGNGEPVRTVQAKPPVESGRSNVSTSALRGSMSGSVLPAGNAMTFGGKGGNSLPLSDLARPASD
jgi:TPR repeat protein